MGFNSLQEDIQERYDERQRRLDREKISSSLIKALNQPIDKATPKQERESHAAKIKQLKDWYERKIKDHELGRHYVGQQLGKRPSTHHRNQRPSIKLRDHLTPDQKMKLLKMIDSRARTDLTARGGSPSDQSGLSGQKQNYSTTTAKWRTPSLG